MAEVPARGQATLLTHFAAAFIGLAAFGGVCLGIARALPMPEVPSVSPKYRYFADNRDKYDTIFLGSSRFYHQIIPREFDDAVEKLTGRRTRSFNIAYDAVWPPESYFLLRELLALKPAKLRWVLIDAMDINPQLDERNAGTRRQAYWHDWRNTKMAIDWISGHPPMTKAQRRELITAHLTLLLKQWVNLGRGAEFIAEKLEMRRTKKPKPPEWHADEGYHPGGVVGLTGEARASYLRIVERLKRGIPPAAPAPAFAKAMEEIVAEVRAAGAEPIFVIAPTLNERENLLTIPGGAPLIPLNDPQKYPVLYDPDLHYDGWHLNERGAHVFTRILAEQFAAKTAPPQP